MVMKIIGIIPARGGSKGIPKKNIKEYLGKPLIAYSIDQSLKSKYINETFVSTDDKEIQQIAIEYGAESPFLRPDDISQDLSPDKDFLIHFAYWYQFNRKDNPKLLVQLRPTYPNRDVTIIDDAIEKFLSKYDEFDSLRTIVENEKTPYKMYTIFDDKLRPLFENVNDLVEPYNQARQLLPKTYLHNGYLDIVKTENLILTDSITGKRIMPYLLKKDETDDIDTIEDWEKSEEKFRKINMNRDK
jgi:CMP-N,N'-diacetyllegionaminic acid synthase